MNYTIDDLVHILQPKAKNIVDSNARITQIAYDTRNIAFAEKSVFFAFKGKRLDANDFIEEAIAKGIKSVVLPIVALQSIDTQKYNDVNFLFVDDVLKALQTWATHHRAQFQLPVIGITGSNGKTIVKEWLNQLLAEDYYIVRSPRSYNSQLGVPLSVLEIDKTHDLGIFEAGISQVGEMERLAPMIRCDIGIFTNIGDAHNSGFVSMEAKVVEKYKLFEESKIIIYCSDYALLKAYQPKTAEAVTWSYSDDTTTFLKVALHKNIDLQHSILKGKLQNGNELILKIPFTDAASIENIIHCWVLMLHYGYDMTTIQQRMNLLRPVELRMEMKSGINNCLIINDAYSLDMTSLRFALDFMAQQSQKTSKTLMLSDIPQSSIVAEVLYAQVSELIQSKGIHRLIAIGNDISIIANFLPKGITYEYFQTTADFLAKADFSTFQNETILLKGARVFEFERIAAQLELKAHRTVLEINLDALRHNLTMYNKRLQAGTKILVMVKASAYGSGGAEVAKLLEYQKVDYLGVAYTDEAVTLRKEGVKLPILVLNPEESTFHLLLKYDIEPEVYCFSQLKTLLSYLQYADRPLKVHLKLDTGMHRLGFEPNDIAALLDILQQHKDKVLVQSVFSHLAASDGAAFDDFTAEQAQRFTQMYDQITTALGYRPIRHLCNTSGITRFPQYHFDMVRLGIGIYGVDSSPAMQSMLQVVNTLKTRISQIKNIAVGETIGYSRRGVATAPMRIATIGIGYADGLLRAAGNGRFAVAVRNELAPIVGNVCMDMCMIDITNIPDVKEGDEVTIFGAYPIVNTLAEATQTIAYEVFTNISERVKRVYYSNL